MRDKRPIYLVLTAYFPLPDSWRCPFVYDQVCAIQRARPGWRVVVAHLASSRDYTYQGVDVLGVATKPIVFRGGSLFPGFLTRLNAARLYAKLSAHSLDWGRVEVVHAHNPSAAALALHLKRHFAKKCLILAQLHHPEPVVCVGIAGWRGILRFPHYRWVLERVDAVVSISSAVTKMLLQFPRQQAWKAYAPAQRLMKTLRWFRSIRPQKVLLLHNGVDVARFSSIGRAPHKAFVIGCIANFIDWKGQITLLQAMAQLTDALGDWTLRMIGTGECLEECKAFVEKKGLEQHVVFEQEVDHTQLPAFYRELDLFVLPSFFEAFGCVFTEAWACGTPFITCEGQGMDDLIPRDERHLWLCKEQNAEDLARKIAYFYRHRPIQHLASAIEIDVLVEHFLNTLEKDFGIRQVGN